MTFSEDEPCYYELLGIDPEASQEEIKRAYRKKALQLHPDKNPGNIEVATETFKAFKKAYDTLSKPEDRIKYDFYRESIIQGVPKEDLYSTIDLEPYFNSRIFKGYEGPKSFYEVYGMVFDTLIEEEAIFVKTKTEFPTFGDAEKSYSDVIKFYNYWQNFLTQRTYFWNEPYDLEEAEDRFERRQMEQQNKKHAQTCKKARNVEIRKLADFVKPLDDRIKKHLKKKAEEKEQLQKQKELEAALKQANAVQEQKNQSKKEEKPFSCGPCNRKFKAEKDLHAHEMSDGHKNKLEAMSKHKKKGKKK